MHKHCSYRISILGVVYIVCYLNRHIFQIFPFNILNWSQDTSPYVEINNMELAATKLKEFADDYTLNTNKPMDLVFFKASLTAWCLLWLPSLLLIHGITSGCTAHCLISFASWILKCKAWICNALVHRTIHFWCFTLINCNYWWIVITSGCNSSHQSNLSPS